VDPHPGRVCMAHKKRKKLRADVMFSMKSWRLLLMDIENFFLEFLN
jgi:hypothetical protein